jgi:Sulfotransferase domain
MNRLIPGRLLYPVSTIERGLTRARIMRRPPLPDFLGIGVPKAGTTWLFENLAAHPEVFIPLKKEIHYFDRNWFQPLSWYSRRFAEGIGRVKGEITPTYCSLPLRRIRAIRSLIPAVRLLVLLRDPVERDWSHLRMALIGETGRSPAEVSVNEYLEFAEGHPRMRGGDYVEIFDRWLGVFDASRLFVGQFEDLVARPRHLLEEVFAHLGLFGPHPWDDLPIHGQFLQGVPTPMPPAVRRFLVDKHSGSLAELRPFVGSAPIEQWRSSWERAAGV